jgi:hypothetical protein
MRHAAIPVKLRWKEYNELRVKAQGKAQSTNTMRGVFGVSDSAMISGSLTMANVLKKHCRTFHKTSRGTTGFHWRQRKGGNKLFKKTNSGTDGYV